MGILQWAEEKTDALTMWDIGVVKIYCVLFGVIVGAYIPVFVRENLWWFVCSVLFLGLGLGVRWFTVEPR
jgi:hypothetical protein